MDNSEKSYKSQGLIGSLIFHCLILALFFLFVLRTPDPPLSTGGSGIELNYGVVDEGFGDVQTHNEASNNPLEEENNSPQPDQPAAEEPQPQTPPEPEPEPVQEQVKDLLASEDPEAPKLEVKEVPKKEVQPKEVKVKKEVVKETSVKTPVEVKSNTTKAVASSSTPDPTSGQTAGGNNNGDKEGKVGDQGNPQGNVNAKALYGNLGEGGEGNGGTGGNKLDLNGWRLDFKLERKDVTNENGKIVFQIKVDDKGDLVSIVAIEKTVSPAVVKFYQDEIVENWAVDRTKENVNPPPLATGKYTVFVRSK